MSDSLWSSKDLGAFFSEVVRQAFRRRFGMTDEELCAYLSGMLTQFTLFDNVYRLRSTAGQRLTEVAEMLVEGDVRLNATSFAREREVHRHIGDFTLFWTGIYPESVPRMKSVSHDLLIDYRRQGKESYHIVSTFEIGQYRDQAPLFKRLSEEFDQCVEGLHLVRKSWDSFAGH